MRMGFQPDTIPAEEELVPNLPAVVKQLRKERGRVQKQLSGLDAAIKAFAHVYNGTGTLGRKRRKMSAKSRAKIAAAQRARWAKFRKSKA
jgi:hypothetical protein